MKFNFTKKLIILFPFVIICNLFIKTIDSCLFQQKLGEKEKDEWIKKHYARDTSFDCTCGPDPPKTNDPDQKTAESDLKKPWHLYIHLKQITKNNKSPLIRTCLGTLINSKMLLTSHTCLKIEKKKIPVYELWSPRPKHMNSVLSSIANLEVSFEPKYPTIDKNNVFTVSEIITKTSWILMDETDNSQNKIQGDDVAIIVLEKDIDMKVHIPICLPRTYFDPTGYKGYYFGIGGIMEADPTPEFRQVGHLTILPGYMCDEENGLGKNDTILCTQYRLLSPTTTGGQLIMATDGMVNQRGFTPGKYVYLIGLASLVNVKPKQYIGSWINTTYFTNILPLIPYLEYFGNKLKAKWCKNTPGFNLGKRADLKMELLEMHEWEGTEPIKRNEDLDCVCGIKTYDWAPQGRSIGGETALPKEFPWQIYLDYKYDMHSGEEAAQGACGGSIINDRIILTAAHCVINLERIIKNSKLFPDHVYVFAKLHSTSPLDTDVVIKKFKNIYYIKDYVDEILQNGRLYSVLADIALIELEQPFAFSNVKEHAQAKPGEIRPVCLPNPGVEIEVEGKQGTASGWGITAPDPEHTHPVFWKRAEKLNKLQVPMWKLEECVKRTDGRLGDYGICGGIFNPSQDVTMGDSGGPLSIRGDNGYYTQVGLVSFNKGYYNFKDIYLDSVTNELTPRLENTVTIYTNIQKYLRFVDYISNKVGAHWCKSNI